MGEIILDRNLRFFGLGWSSRFWRTNDSLVTYVCCISSLHARRWPPERSRLPGNLASSNKENFTLNKLIVKKKLISSLHQLYWQPTPGDVRMDANSAYCRLHVRPSGRHPACISVTPTGLITLKLYPKYFYEHQPIDSNFIYNSTNYCTILIF